MRHVANCKAETSGGGWDALTDAELTSLRFDADNPEELPNLLDSVPVTTEVPEIEFAYDTTGTNVGMVRCRHCKKTATNHNRGFVARYANGSRILLGKNCGEKQFGVAFRFRQERFRVAQKRANLLLQRAQFVANRRKLIDLVEHLESEPIWDAFATARRSFSHGLSFLVGGLVQAAVRDEGRLYVTEQVRDHEAEARQNSEKRPYRPVFKSVTREYGRLRGVRFFYPGEYPHKVIESLAQRLKSALYTIEAVEATRDLELSIRGIRELIDKLNGECDRAADLERALSVENLEMLSGWLKALGRGSYRVAEGRFYRYDAARQVVSVMSHSGIRLPAEMELPLNFHPVPYSTINELQALIQVDRN